MWQVVSGIGASQELRFASVGTVTHGPRRESNRPFAFRALLRGQPLPAAPGEQGRLAFRRGVKEMIEDSCDLVV